MSKLQNNIRFRCYTPAERQQVLAPFTCSAELACHLLRVCWLALPGPEAGIFCHSRTHLVFAGVITALLRIHTVKADLCAVVSRWALWQSGVAINFTVAL